MKSRLVKRLSALLSPKTARKQRRKFQVGTVQRLENRHLLTAPTLDILYDLTVAEDAAERSVALTGITAGGTESQPLRVTATSSNTTLLANPTIDYTSPNSTGTLRFTPAANRSGNSIITVTVTDGGPDLNLNTTSDNETFLRTFRVTVTPVNDAPTLNPLLPLTISEDASQQTVALSGITAGPLESQPLRVRATSSDTAIIPNPTVTYTSPQNSGSIRFTPNANRFGAVTITVTVEDGGPDSNLNTLTDNATFSRSFVVTINGQNDAPSFDSIADLSISEDAGEQTVNVTGISAGPFETQALILSATSSNSGLIPDPTVNYTSPGTTGTLKFTPTANLFGTALITVVLQDPGQDENPATTVDNLTFTRSFTVTVAAVNDAPTLDPINNVAINEDDAEQVVSLTGITAGPLENQTLRISAVSSVPGLIPNPSVTYASPDATGELRFTPVADQNGIAVVTVTAEDAGPDGDFATASDNASFQRTFTVTVAAVNDTPTINDPGNLTIDEDAAEQTISLSGITAGGGESQALRVTASSDNTLLTGTPAVFYTSPNSTGSVKFTPAANLSGSATITVTVEDPGADGDFDTSTDNLTATRTILVTVNAVNDVPTVDELDNLLLSRDAAPQTVNLAGITAGGGETQSLQVTTSSSNTLLIPDPTVNYTSPNATGSISVAPVAGQSGSAVITVTVTDAGLDGDLLTTADNGIVTVTFTVWINDPPTIDDVSEVNIAEDAAEQSVNLTGISGGIGESSQKVRISATSGNMALIPSVSIDYTEAAATGTLRFTPVSDGSGSSVITITVDDAGIDNDFTTTDDNVTTTKTFTVNVSPVNDAPTLADPDDLTIAEDAAEQTVNLTDITAGGGETQPLRITAFSSDLSLIADITVDYTSPQNTGALKFTPISNISGSVVISVVVTDGGLDNDLNTEFDNSSSTQTFTVNISPVNDVPTIDSLFDSSIDEDNAEISVDLSGITAGGGESQPLRVTAVSSDTSVIAIVFVDYASASSTGTLRYQPQANQSGSSTITVTVTDGGFDGDLDTPADNAVFEVEFTVTVNPVNDAPTLDALSDITIDEDAPEQTVNLAGISAGGGENQALRVFASSGNTDLISTPNVTYTSGDATGAIRFSPSVNQFGTTVIFVIVQDAGLDGNFDTSDDLTVTRTFAVTVNSVNDAPTIDQPDDETVDEDASEQTLTLYGITAGGGETQPLSVSFSYTNPALFAAFSVIYTSPETTCDVVFIPAPEASGQSRVTMMVEDGGPDLDLATTGDNTTTQITFLIIISAVNDAPTLDPLYELTISEDSASHSVDLFGISAGANESQPLRVTTLSSDPSIVPNPSATYVSPNATGSIQFQSLPNAFGEIEITVTVTDGGLDGDLSTEVDNGSVSQVFTLRVTPINDPPSVNPVTDQTISEDAAEQTVNLTGITAGPLESQPIKVTATSSNTALIPNPVVTYTTPESTAVLTYQPIADQSGVVVITIFVEDGGGDARLDTTTDNVIFTSTFTVTVNAVNDDPTLDQPGDLTINEDAGLQKVQLTNVTAGGGETQPLLITATSNNIALVPNPSVVFDDLFHPELQFTTVADQSGEATITVVVTDGGLDGDLSTTGDNASVTRTFTVTVNPVNDAPTLDQPDNVVIDEDAAEQTISLAGITAGGGENQPISVSATSSNTDLIADPMVIYSSPNATGSLKFTPSSNLSGSTVITVVVSDGGFDGDLSTTTDNSTLTLTFSITVNAVNDMPTLDQPGDLTINEDAEEQTVSLSGITAGGGEVQPLMVTAFSEFPAIIADPAVTYSSDDSTGSLTFIPAANVSGVVEITVVVIDGGLDGNLETTTDNGSATYKFKVTVNPVNDTPTLDQPGDLTIDEDADEQTVSLSGITAGGGENQPLRVSATSGNSSIIANPTIVYSSADTAGTLKFTPVADQFGSVDITVEVVDGGLDGNLDTKEDNGIFSLVFSVTVSPVNDIPTMDYIADLSIDEDSGEQIVNLSGIMAGGGENQLLAISATSNNTILIDNPSVIYTSADSIGILKFSPATNLSGSAVITVELTDGGLDGDLSTRDDNASMAIIFNVIVNPVNDAPTLDQPGNVLVDEDSAEQTVELTGITAGGGEIQPISITATSSDSALIADPVVIYTSADPTASLRFTPTADLSGVAVITVMVTDGGFDGDLSTTDDNSSFTLEFEITVNPVNDIVVIDQPLDVTIDEDAPEYTVDLTGIAAGGGENQPLSITATSSNSTLIPDPAVVYTSPDATGSLKFTPAANFSGTAVITVGIMDGGLDGLLSTTDDNSSIAVIFTVTVNPVNDVPTLDQIPDVTISEDAPEQSVNLTGISAGGGELQSLNIIATSSDTSLIANPSITYTDGGTTGTLRFTPTADLSGSAVITVTVTDPGLDGDFSTTGDNEIFERTFTVTVTAVNDTPTLDQLGDITLSEDAAEQIVNLTGISAGGGESQPLQVTATSSNAALIADPVVTYSGPDSTGSIRFTPAANLSGTTIISVVVTDGGLDGDLATSGDNGSFTRTFTVLVNAVNDAPTLDQPGKVTVSEDAPEQTISLTGITAGGGEMQPLQVVATSSNTTLIADPAITYSSPNSTGSLRFTPTANLSGSAVITVVVTDGGLDGDLATSGDNSTVTRTFTVTVNAVNDAPTLDQPGNVTISEDAAEQTVNLTGITAGGGESQPLQVTATSSDATLIANPAVIYSGPNSTGSLKFTPAANLSGMTMISVVVTDGGLDGDLSTTEDNASVTLTFTVTVNAVNDAPTLNQPGNVTILEDAPEQTVSLTGISAGGGESQPLQITATSSNTLLIANPAVTYSSPNATGSLKFTPTANLSGTAVVTVVVTDGGLDGDLATTVDNGSLTRTFTVTVNAVNDAPTLDALPNLSIQEDSPVQTVQLTGITAGGGETQPLQVTATSSDPSLIPNPAVTYTSANSTGTLTFTPVTNKRGSVVITVSVQDGGLDGDLSTASDNQTFNRMFTVEVTPIRAVVISPVGSVLVQRPQITWTSVPNAVSYNIWIDNVSAGQRPLLQATTTTTTFLPTIDLGIGKIDVFIRAVTANGTQLPWSQAYRFNLVQQLVPNSINPIQPTGLPTITWPAITGATRYDVAVDDVSRGITDFIRTSVTTTSWIPATELQIGRYRFYARGVAADETTAWWSNALEFTVSTAPRPIAPVTATFNRLPEFVWSAVSGATSYRLQVRNDATGKVVYEISGLANTSWTPPTALSSGNHSWIVAGFSAAGSIIGNYSTRTFFFVGGRPTITAPIGTASSVQPQLQWQNVVGAATYQVQLNRSFGGASETVIFNISGITTNSFVPPNPLIRGASYRFWVRAVSLTGEVSVWSLPGAFTVASLEAVDGPQTSPAGIPDVSLAVLESQFERPAATVRKTAVERSQDAVDESGDSAESVLVVSAAIAQHTTAMEAVAETNATADIAAVDEAISDVVEMLLSGGLLLN